MDEKIKTELLAKLADATEGMTTLEKALFVADVWRNAYGGEWSIRAMADGSFIIEKTR